MVDLAVDFFDVYDARSLSVSRAVRVFWCTVYVVQVGCGSCFPAVMSPLMMLMFTDAIYLIKRRHLLQVKPPKGLMGRMRELFCEQEQQRQELLLQHSKERVRHVTLYHFTTTTCAAAVLLLLFYIYSSLFTKQGRKNKHKK